MIVLGAKGFAKEVLEVLWQLQIKENIAFFDDVSKELPDLMYDRHPILRNIEEVKIYMNKVMDKRFVLGVGNCTIREKMYKTFCELGSVPFTMISTRAIVGRYSVKIDTGCTIMSGAIITSDVEIGEGCLINLNCTIGHDCKIGRFTELSPGVHVSGRCTIGDKVSIGTGAVLLPDVDIGDNTTIGAGAVVTRSIPSNSIAVGVPAKVIKSV